MSGLMFAGLFIGLFVIASIYFANRQNKKDGTEGMALMGFALLCIALSAVSMLSLLFGNTDLLFLNLPWAWVFGAFLGDYIKRI